MVSVGASARTAGIGDAATADLQRRAANLVRYGTVERADHAAARLRVRIGGADDPAGSLLTDWIPWAAPRAGNDVDWAAPEIGEPVVVLAPSGELHTAIALPAGFSTAYPAPADRPEVRRTVFRDGTVVEYDRAAHRYLVDVTAAGGTIVLKAGASTLTLTPDRVTVVAPLIDLNP